MATPDEVRAVAEVLDENREFLGDTLAAFGDPFDPGYDLDIAHVQALSQGYDLLNEYADLLEGK